MKRMIIKDMHKRNYYLDFIKGISCALVVFIHVRFPGVFGSVVVAFARTAVVSFFMLSGYYLYYGNIETTLKKLPFKISRTAKLMTLSLGIYLIWEVFVRFVGSGLDSVSFFLKSVFSIESILKFIVLSNDPVVGHLWFLIALTTSYVLFFIVLKHHMKPKFIWALVLLEIHIFIMALSNLNGWNLSMCWFRNAWFYGFPCMVIGYVLHESQQRIKNYYSNILMCIGIFLGILLTLIEWNLIGSLQIYNGTLFIVICVFSIAIRNAEMFKKNLFSKIGRDYSQDVYVFHYIVGELFDKIGRIFNLYQTWYLWIFPILVLIASIIVAHIIFNIKNIMKH